MKTRIAAATARIGIAGVLIAVATTTTGAAAGLARNSNACDGGRIAFMREGSGPPVIYTMSARGGDLTSVVVGHAPSWSPDGRWIAFDDSQHIDRMRPNGSHITDLTPSLQNVSTYDPAWSPDGRWIAFVSAPSGTRDAALWLVRADGSNLHELINAPGEEEHPSWSPDGSRIAFDSFPATGPDHVFTVRFDGTDLDRITADALDAWGPSWSSQNLIAFANGASSATNNIFTIRPDGSHLRQLTNAPHGVTLGLPSFSPDGADIAFTRINAAFTSAEVFRMTVAGGHVHGLTPGQPGFNSAPSWGTCR